ncbi:MAG: type secretory pathway, ATPase PulE/Tfp pilus assembly pathway, ATPase PilB [Planctomycetota bacterium]|nr:type secretory pathway, ATPase PulE/Tfp pilus assembly pathway, ATPase PilB [Planctomycetota bacterium]
MNIDLSEPLRRALAGFDPKAAKFATEAVDQILGAARTNGASDIHLQPEPHGLDIRWRIDGVLHPAATLPISLAPNIIARLKVLADLLTYRNDAPQEGRIRSAPGEVEMRVSTFPTLHGEKAVIRLFAETGRYRRVTDLGLPAEIASALTKLLSETAGMILLTGPAGGGKTTTIYACLRELVAESSGRRSLTSLEDPIEVAVTGVAQSQVNPSAGFDLAIGLRSLMRQDPEVIAVGEIRDRATAEGAFGASLTGHLVLSTFHAGSAAGAVGRLSDMGIEPYVLRSGLLAVVGQRLVRKLCVECSREITHPDEFLGLRVRHARTAVGCSQCGGTGYRGRMLLAEILIPGNTEVGRVILDRTDVARVEEAAVSAGMVTRWDRARQAVEAGATSPAEVRRVLGFSEGADTHPPQ